jgi:septum formation inhibitor MinC
MNDDKKISMHLRCILTDEEKLAAGRELAESTNQLNEIESDKKRVSDDFKAKASTAEAQIGILSNKLRSGYEFRQVECLVVFDDPKPGEKTIYRTDIKVAKKPGETVEVRRMTEEEKQRQLILEPTLPESK